MKKPFNFIALPIFSLFFLAIVLTSCKKEVVDIDSPEREVKGFLKGKWHVETVSGGGLVTYYRFEITETEVKTWTNDMIVGDNGNLDSNEEWKELTPVTLSIGNTQTDSEGYKDRILWESSYGTVKLHANLEGETFVFFNDLVGNSACYPKKGWEY